MANLVPEYSNGTVYALKMPGRIIIGADSRLTNYFGGVVRNDYCKIVTIGASGTVYAAWTGRRDLCESIIQYTNAECNLYNTTNVNDIAILMENVVNQMAGAGDSLGFVLGGYFPLDNPKLFNIEKLVGVTVCTLTEGTCFTIGTGREQVNHLAPGVLNNMGQDSHSFVENHVFSQIRQAVQYDWGTGGHIYTTLMAENGDVSRTLHECLNPSRANSGYAAPRAW